MLLCAKIFLISPPQNGKPEDVRTQKYGEVRDLLGQLTTVFNRTYLLDMYEYAPKQTKEFSETYWHGHMAPTGYYVFGKIVAAYVDYIVRKHPKDFKLTGMINLNVPMLENQVE